MKIGLVGPSYQERSIPFDGQRTINLYPVFDKEGKEVSALYGTPGLELFSTCGVGPVRGCFCSANDRAFVVSGGGLYELSSTGTATLRGSLDTSTGIVSIDENGVQLAVCDGVDVYIFTYATNAFAKVSDGDLPTASTLTFIDGYFVVSEAETGKFFLSALYDGTSWAALDFATAESSPDDLHRVYNAVGQLWLFGGKTTEIWTNTGAASFPFERISGAKMEMGLLAPHSVCAVDNSVFWIGRDNIGAGIVYRAQGFSPARISTNAIELKIQAVSSPETLRAYTYQQDGHTFYMITGGGLETTLVYDISTQLWHERAYLNAFGEFEAHLGSCGMFAFSRQLVGSRLNGKVYTMSQDIYEDDGREIKSQRIFTHLSDEGARFKANSLQVDFEYGVGPTSEQSASRYIKRIQTGSVTISANASSGTASITEVDPSYAVVLYNGFTTANSSAFDASITLPALTLTDGTTVTARTSAADASNARVVQFTVLEFYPVAISRIQTGTTTIAAGSKTNTSTITPVDTSQSAIFFQGCTYSANSATISNIYQYVALTNSTTVTGSCSQNVPTSHSSTSYWTVVEFAEGVIESVQAKQVKINTSQTTGTSTINQVVPEHSILLFNGFSIPDPLIGGTTTDTTRYPYAYISDSTTITAVRGGSSASLTSAIQVTVLEFIADIVNGKQTGQTAISSGNTQKLNTVSSVSTSMALLNTVGFTTSTSTSARPDQTFARIKLASATSVQQDRAASASNNLTQAWELLEFKVRTTESTPANDPMVWLRISRDGGKTWSNEYQASIGALGEYRSRAVWRRLGIASMWTLEISITDPVKRAICGAYLN